MTDKELWKKISQFQLDDPESDFTFSQRLARDNGWGLGFAKDVIKEYKQFIYLCCVSNSPVTPSDAVDQAWHLHLTYTRSYWKDFCKNTLGRDIHHNPTKGGRAEKDKFGRFYNRTFELYENEFGSKPPSEIWLNSTKRFSEINFKRINADNFWLIPKPSEDNRKLILVGIFSVATIFLFVNAKNGTVFFIVLAFIFILISMLNSNSKGGKGGNGGNNGCGFGCSSCSGCSGCGGCGGD